MPGLALSLFGSFEATFNGKLITGLESRKIQALLALLALESHQAHSREYLAALLWPDSETSSAYHNLRQALSSAKQALSRQLVEAPLLLTTREAVRFNQAGGHWVDAAEFTSLWAACNEHSHASLESCQPCLEKLKRLAALYRGQFLAHLAAEGETFAPWLRQKQEQFERQALVALERLAASCELRGEYAQAQHYAERQLAIDP